MTTPIVGIPTTRVSESFVRNRLLTQAQYDQTELYRIQMQLSTGHRFQAPSEDPVAALRVMSLQRLLEQKTQSSSNLNANESFLSIADTSLMNVAGLLSEVRATTLGAMGTTATDLQRQTAASEVLQTLQQLCDTGNQLFRGRYIFGGTTTATQPFNFLASGLAEYLGNQGHLATYGDVDLLFQSNLTGDEVFGAISQPVEGSIDLDPVLTYDTRLSDLRGGQGLSRGSILISDGSHTSTIDFRDCETIGELAAKIKRNPPAGRALTVELTPDSLKITLDAEGGGALSIREVGGGTTAAELGILRETGSGRTIEGRDLDAVVRNTTQIADVLGTRARAVVRSTGDDNDFIIEATANGAQTADGRPLNDVNISFVDDPLVVAGEETVVYDGNHSLVVHIAAGKTQAYQVVAAVNRAQQAGDLPFTARLDRLDNPANGSGRISVGATATTQYGAGQNLDQTSGLQIINRQQTFEIDFSACHTVEDLLNTLNGAGAGVLAEINAGRTGINLRSRVSGCDFAVGENGGQTASQLGLRTFTNNTLLDGLNFGRGVDDWAGSGARASATYESAVSNSTLSFASKNPGAYWNDFDIRFTSTLGQPSVAYDAEAKTLEFKINPGTTTANDIVRLLQDNAAASADWSVSLPAAAGAANNGSGLVAVGNVTASGGDDSGIDFTITRADGVELAIDIAGKTNIGQILDVINNHYANADHALVAQLAVDGNGIELVDNSAGGGSLVVRRSATSRAAIDLGLVAEGADESAAATLGGPAATSIASTAAKSGLIFRGKEGGTDVNGVRVIFQAGPAGCDYDAVAGTLTFGITPGVTTAADIKQMLETSAAASTFTADFDPTDTSGNDGSGYVAATDPLAPAITGDGSATTYATARLQSAGFDNDLIFSATHLGSSANGVQIELVAHAGGPAAVTDYEPGVRLVIQYDPGVSDANDVIAALAADPAASADFTAALDPGDASGNDGSGLVDATTGLESPLTGGRQSLSGGDVNLLETEGVFTALVRIQQGLIANDQFTIERGMEMLDSTTVNMNFARGQLGALEQSVSVLQDRNESEQIELQRVISDEYDVDVVQATSDFTARQVAYQAALQSTAQILQLTLLDYL